MHLPITVGISPTLKIRGIIAEEDIEKGQIIERCPVILLNVTYDKFIEETPLRNYYFEWTKENSAVVLGYGSLYNHSYSPNAQFEYNFQKILMIYKAIKDIKQGEEIFINYNYFPKSRKKLDPGHLNLDPTYNTKTNIKSLHG